MNIARIIHPLAGKLSAATTLAAISMLAGNGPCNRERLGARVKAWEDGAWFRDGLTAYAAKDKARHASKPAAAAA